jgi:hypothetical protein
MIDLVHPPGLEAVPARPDSTELGPCPCLAHELYELAGDLAGRPDRDELSRDEERRLGQELDEAVAAVLPYVIDALEAELRPRIETLPPHTRVALVRARERRALGLE